MSCPRIVSLPHANKAENNGLGLQDVDYFSVATLQSWNHDYFKILTQCLGLCHVI